MTTNRRRIDGSVQAAIEEKAVDRWTPAQIRRWLAKEPMYEGRLPTLRTVERIVRDVTPRDDSEDWSLGDTDIDNDGQVLYLIRETILRTSGTVSWFSKALADWVFRVERVAPGLRSHAIYYLATSYLRAKQTDSPAREYDAFLAFRPWETSSALQRYEKAILDGWIPKAPDALMEAMKKDEKDEPGVYPKEIKSRGSETNNG
jgi:hypothetical protein